MGGESYKCPKCEKWYLIKGQVHDHLIGKHGEPRGFTLEGVAGGTRIVRVEKGQKRRKYINEQSVHPKDGVE